MSAGIQYRRDDAAFDEETAEEAGVHCMRPLYCLYITWSDSICGSGSSVLGAVRITAFKLWYAFSIPEVQRALIL